MKKGSGPPVIRFKARLEQHSRAANNGSSSLLNVPKLVGKKLSGMTLVEGTINGHPFRAALERGTSGSRTLRVNKAMRNGAGADAGDTVQLAILGPEAAPKVPADLRVAFATSHEAKALWQDLTADARRVWIRWIESTNVRETRARRVRRTVEQLSEGKRRPCCVNVYEFMLDRVQR
jgi:Bacteriocin-protection, YdeI or OmpD-Associated/Domain of unknown function (DUF1905)